MRLFLASATCLLMLGCSHLSAEEMPPRSEDAKVVALAQRHLVNEFENIVDPQYRVDLSPARAKQYRIEYSPFFVKRERTTRRPLFLPDGRPLFNKFGERQYEEVTTEVTVQDGLSAIVYFRLGDSMGYHHSAYLQLVKTSRSKGWVHDQTLRAGLQSASIKEGVVLDSEKPGRVWIDVKNPQKSE